MIRDKRGERHHERCESRVERCLVILRSATLEQTFADLRFWLVRSVLFINDFCF
jgi:hypothetical protein